MTTLNINDKFFLITESIAFFKILDRKVGILFIGSKKLVEATRIINSKSVDDFDLVLEDVEANHFLSNWGLKI